ncbi:conjugal transfer pilus assembly protein TrbC (plasmid) [Rickettsiales bacterium Ac37b]|nr:conjugal transfer pilus assembly protein TrbC [Rickettsiales bacterium Ac37b]
MLYFLAIAFCMNIFTPYNYLDAAEILSTEELRQIEKNVTKEAEKFKQIAQEVEVKVKSKDPVITEKTENPKQTQDKSKLVANILNNYNQVQKGSCDASDREGFRIFVSFSMPKGLLRDLDQVARKISARLVIRGLKDNSFKSTIDYLKAGNDSIIIDIDPEAFELFDIHHVPSFVLSRGNSYDKLVGNVSIPYVLKEFASSGDLKHLVTLYQSRIGRDI